MKFSSILSTVSLASTALSISVLVPLYIYPDPGMWEPVYGAISSNPDVNFIVIVNPESGPGAGTAPEDDYATGIRKLHQSGDKVTTIGYVATNYTARPQENTQNDITKYANWPSDVAPTGIFFDEGTYGDEQFNRTYMSNVASFARTAFHTPSTLIFNPGTTEPDYYFDLADYIVDFEKSFQEYDVARTPGSLGHGDKSAIIVNETPAGTDLDVAVKTAGEAGIGAIYFTDGCCYQETTLVQGVAEAVAKVV